MLLFTIIHIYSTLGNDRAATYHYNKILMFLYLCYLYIPQEFVSNGCHVIVVFVHRTIYQINFHL